MIRAAPCRSRPARRRPANRSARRCSTWPSTAASTLPEIRVAAGDLLSDLRSSPPQLQQRRRFQRKHSRQRRQAVQFARLIRPPAEICCTMRLACSRWQLIRRRQASCWRPKVFHHGQIESSSLASACRSTCYQQAAGARRPSVSNISSSETCRWHSCSSKGHDEALVVSSRLFLGRTSCRGRSSLRSSACRSTSRTSFCPAPARHVISARCWSDTAR